MIKYILYKYKYKSNINLYKWKISKCTIFVTDFN